MCENKKRKEKNLTNHTLVTIKVVLFSCSIRVIIEKRLLVCEDLLCTNKNYSKV